MKHACMQHIAQPVVNPALPIVAPWSLRSWPPVLWQARTHSAMHFMHLPPAIAFGAGDTFGTCGDGDNSGSNFMGPALFSADPAVFAKPTPDEALPPRRLGPRRRPAQR